MVNDRDETPVLINTKLISATEICWNPDGTVLAIAGTGTAMAPDGSSKSTPVVQFYSPWGRHLRTLKVPGPGIKSISREGSGLRIALAVGNYIYFANVRPAYMWGYFQDTVVYAYQRPDRSDMSLMFWNTKTSAIVNKLCPNLIAVRAAGSYCVWVKKNEKKAAEEQSYILVLCDAIGSPVQSKLIKVEPEHLCMTSEHIVAVSRDTVFVWNYNTAALTGGRVRRSQAVLDRAYHIDTDVLERKQRGGRNARYTATGIDPIVAATTSTTTLILGRASGTVLALSLPTLEFKNSYQLEAIPAAFSLNCDATKLLVLNVSGVVSMLDLVTPSGEGKNDPIGVRVMGEDGKNYFERKDCWDMRWSDDNPDLFVIMEKTRMFTFRGVSAEEPVVSSGYLAGFTDLCVQAVCLDEIMRNPGVAPHPDSFIHHETKTLRDTRTLISSENYLTEAIQFIEDNPHPRLWRLLAQAALEQLQFEIAQQAFVKCRDYQGIQLVKRLKLTNLPQRQRAEVAVYFGNWKEAEDIYISIDQRNLAIELRENMGNWVRVISLIREKKGHGDDARLLKAHNALGDYYAERQIWSKAKQRYLKTNNVRMLMKCAYHLDDFKGLSALVNQLPAGTEYLREIGTQFQSVGLCEEAVEAFLLAEEPQAAVDCCVQLNEWKRAIDLATEHKFPQIEGLLTKYAGYLLGKNEKFQAVELYHKANRAADAAKLLISLAESNSGNPLRAKKLYVLAALEIERSRSVSMTARPGHSMAEELTSLMEHENTAAQQEIGNPWHGAEAYHFLMLCQRQLASERYDDAFRSALRLAEYEDVLDVKTIYSLIALMSNYNRKYGQCSRAFIRLESIGTPEEQAQFRSLAVKIFVPNPPRDPVDQYAITCPNQKCSEQVPSWAVNCGGCGRFFPACVATGRPIQSTRDTFTCRSCNHQMFANVIGAMQTCPLCHSPLH
jgi:WD repeat-containing protein 35